MPFNFGGTVKVVGKCNQGEVDGSFVGNEARGSHHQRLSRSLSCVTVVPRKVWAGCNDQFN